MFTSWTRLSSDWWHVSWGTTAQARQPACTAPLSAALVWNLASFPALKWARSSKEAPQVTRSDSGLQGQACTEPDMSPKTAKHDLQVVSTSWEALTNNYYSPAERWRHTHTHTWKEVTFAGNLKVLFLFFLPISNLLGEGLRMAEGRTIIYQHQLRCLLLRNKSKGSIFSWHSPPSIALSCALRRWLELPARYWLVFETAVQ